MRFTSAFALIVLFLLACDREPPNVPENQPDVPEIQPHWLRASDGVLLEPRRVIREGRSSSHDLPMEREYGTGFVDDLGLSMSIFAQHYGFWFDVRNTTAEPVRIVWPQAAYVDELGERREVYAQPRGVLPDAISDIKVQPPQVIRAGEKKKITIVPIYKQYLVRSGRTSVTPYSEPLIPTTLQDKDEAAMRAYVDDVVAREVPVKLIVPIEVGKEQHVYTIEFVLRRGGWSPP